MADIFEADELHSTSNYYKQGDSPPNRSLLVVHSTRSGIPGNDDVRSTLNWFASPSSQASANLLIGPDGRTYRIVPDHLWAWHAGYLNFRSWGVELAQPTIDDPFTEQQYISLARYTLFLHANYGLPLNHYSQPGATGGFIGHDETSQGRGAGKSDPGPLFDWSAFAQLLDTTDELPLLLDPRLRELEWWREHWVDSILDRHGKMLMALMDALQRLNAVFSEISPRQ